MCVLSFLSESFSLKTSVCVCVWTMIWWISLESSGIRVGAWGLFSFVDGNCTKKPHCFLSFSHHMGFKCAAPGCKTGYKSSSEEDIAGITLHKFPLNNPVLLQKWLHRLSRENFTPNSNSRICSKHFKEDDFVEETRDTNSDRKNKRPRKLLKR